MKRYNPTGLRSVGDVLFFVGVFLTHPLLESAPETLKLGRHLTRWSSVPLPLHLHWLTRPRSFAGGKQGSSSSLFW